MPTHIVNIAANFVFARSFLGRNPRLFNKLRCGFRVAARPRRPPLGRLARANYGAAVLPAAMELPHSYARLLQGMWRSVMRTLLGIILGALLTVGGAYIYDSHNALDAVNAPTTAQKPLVNWDIVSVKWQYVSERA